MSGEGRDWVEVIVYGSRGGGKQWASPGAAPRKKGPSGEAAQHTVKNKDSGTREAGIQTPTHQISPLPEPILHNGKFKKYLAFWVIWKTSRHASPTVKRALEPQRPWIG